VQKDSGAILSIEGLRKWFSLSGGLLSFLSRSRSSQVRAVDGITLNLVRSEAIAIVGESGCGKTTLARLITRLIDPTEGRIRFEGTDITTISGKQLKEYRRKVQITFQNPYDSMNERQTVFEVIREPIMFHKLATTHEQELQMVKRALQLVRLNPPENFISRFISQLSGGERQRVGIARAIIMEPSVLVADEPVSMLDVSIRAELMSLLLELKQKLNMTMIIITHDLAVASYLADRMVVMYLGKVVEIGPADKVCTNPLHPYTKALLDAVPRPDPYLRERKLALSGEPPNAIDPPSGCRFHPRCSFATEECSIIEPQMIEAEEGHYVACVLYSNKSS
jgi:peptide/nickel transport system ATP-binding protein